MARFLVTYNYLKKGKTPWFMGFLCEYSGDIKRFEKTPCGGLVPGRHYRVLRDTSAPTLPEVEAELGTRGLPVIQWRRTRHGMERVTT